MTSRRRGEPKEANPAEEPEEEEEDPQPPLIGQEAAAILAAAFIQAQQAAAAAVAAAAPPVAPAVPAPPVAPPVPFALTPALATQGPLDLSKETGARIFKEGTKSLYAKHDDPFGCNEEGLITFLNRLNNRSKEMGWESTNEALLMIPTGYDAANNKTGPFHNIVTNYGEITKERIQEWERKIDAKPDAQGRLKQDLFMLYKCVTASLSAEGEQKLSTWRADYDYDGILGGLSLLFVITREASLVTNASEQSLRRELNDLDGYAVNVQGDVEKINTKALTIIQKLKARGKDTTELTTNLFKAYETIKDSNFERFISNVRDRHDEGAETLTGEMLMHKAMSKFKILKDQNKWNAPSEDAEKFIALANTISDLKAKIKGKAKKAEAKNDNKGKKPKARPQWLTDNEKPSDLGETKQYNNVTWYWCCSENGGKCGGKWRVHNPKECRGTAGKRLAEEKKEKDEKGEKKPKVKAFESLMDSAQEEHESDSE